MTLQKVDIRESATEIQEHRANVSVGQIFFANPEGKSRLIARAQKHPVKTSRAAQAKRKIMDTAADLFAERGYGNVGINEVGVTAGFGKGALYYHIRSKEDLLVSIIADHMHELIASGQEIMDAHSGTPSRVQALTASFVELMLENPAAMTVCHRDVHAIIEAENKNAVTELHDTYRQFWIATFTEGAAIGEHRSLSEIEIQALLGMYFCTVLWVRSDETSSSEEIVQTLSRTVLDTVMANQN